MGFSIHTALVVKEDLVKGSQATQNLLEAGIVRVFQVSGLSNSFAPESVIPQALIAVGSNGVSIPAMGSPHPDPDFSGAIVTSRATETDPTFDVVNVFVFYRWRNYLGSYLKTCSGALNQVSRLYARQGGGDQYARQYTSGSGSTLTLGVQIAYTPPGAATTKYFPAFVNDQIIEGMVNFKFLEQLDPEYFNSTYPGFCNSQIWRGYQPRTMMILPIQGSSQDNFWYDNIYAFKYRSDTHDRYVFYVDPDTGIVPSDIAKSVRYTGRPPGTKVPATTPDSIIDSGNGWGRFAPEKMVDFNLLFNQLPVAPPDTYGLDFNQFEGS